MIIKETEYARIYFFKEKQLGMIEWLGKCTSEEYRDVFNILLDLQKVEKISRYISDIRKQAIISPDDRKWFEGVAMPKAVEQGLKISGVVFDGNVFKKYYMNAILGALNKYGIPLKLFNKYEDAEAFVMAHKV